MLKLPVRVPVAVGVKVMLTVQLLPPGSGVAQVVVSAKSPLITTVPRFRPMADVFEIVNLIAALVVPTFVVGNVNEVCDKFTAVAVPCSPTIIGSAGSLLWMLIAP